MLESLGVWAREFAHRRLRDEEIDGGLLMWHVQREIDERTAPRALVVLRVEFLDPGCGVERYWLKLEPGVGERCLTHPGIDETLVMRTDARAHRSLAGRARLPRHDRRRSHRHRGAAQAREGAAELVSPQPLFVQLERGHADG